MSDTVFILGAGASKEAGVPVMNDFLKRARTLWNSGVFKDEHREFQTVFNAIGKLQLLHSKSRFNIQNLEEVFSVFEMAKVLGKLGDFSPNEINSIINSLKKVITKTIEHELKFPVQKREKIVSPVQYGNFSKLLHFLTKVAQPKQSVSIITFNYDIAVDFALNESSYISYNYGFEEEKSNKDDIVLLKLHGSINWGKCFKCQKILPWKLGIYLMGHGVSVGYEGKEVSIPIGSQLHEYEHCPGYFLHNEPVIIPPTWDKFYHRNKISQIWKKAASELSEAANIFVIGYSYPETDAFFKYLYSIGSVGDAIIENFWVFNPDKKLEPHFKNLLGEASINSFKYISEGFGYANGEIEKLFSS